jgi:hypothetical protein
VAISTYTELKSAVANWLNRTDLTDRIPEFIALAEADITRNLVLPTIVGADTLDAGSDELDLSAILGYPKSIVMNTTTYMHPLVMTTLPALAELRRIGSGVPWYYAFADGTVHLDVEADSAHAIKIEYVPDLVPLSGAAPTNNTLTRSPDIYLFGSLKEAELYLEHDERNPVWSAKYQKSVADENDARERAQYGAAPVAPRLPINFG